MWYSQPKPTTNIKFPHTCNSQTCSHFAALSLIRLCTHGIIAVPVYFMVSSRNLHSPFKTLARKPKSWLQSELSLKSQVHLFTFLPFEIFAGLSLFLSSILITFPSAFLYYFNLHSSDPANFFFFFLLVTKGNHMVLKRCGMNITMQLNITVKIY